MNSETDFSRLLANEEFQQGIIQFDSYSDPEKKKFIDKYAIGQSEFTQARAIISGLVLKETEFSERELHYLWQCLGVDSRPQSRRNKFSSAKLIHLFSKVAAILFIPLLIVSVLFMERTRELQQYKAEKLDQLSGLYNTVSAPVGGRTTAILPDGSEVILNSGSSLQYAVLDNCTIREVKLSGEGFFRVKKDSQRPMFITLPGMQVKVYGTTFNVRAYDGDTEVETVLVGGKISILQEGQTKDRVSTEHHLSPGEIGRFNKEKGTVIVSSAANLDVFTGWINGKYVFKNMRFRDILSRLEQLYNVKFILDDKELMNSSFDATFENQSIDQIMEIFSISLPIQWETSANKRGGENLYLTRKILIKRDFSKEI